tara:strand:+ start:30 stop:1076 length:1047 start_codon:yes stop_codon:yes gene_type:complete
MSGHKTYFASWCTPARLWQTLSDTEGNITQASRELGVTRSTIKKFMLRWSTDRPAGPELPPLPEGDLPVEELIDIACRRFANNDLRERAKAWRTIKMPTNDPFALAWVGDPHVDNDGCNWPRLRHDLKVIAETDGIYGANIGDSTDNWTGRLLRLATESSTTKSNAFRLCEWMLIDSGVTWLVWLLGNHDLWNEGHHVFSQMVRKPRSIILEDWGAQFQLQTPNKQVFRIWAAHNFSGHSMYNSLHGQQKAAHFRADADLYIAGHTHNWALHQEESASRGFVYWLARARGYKFIDDHATILGHASQQEGATILSVFDPNAHAPAARVQCFADLDTGADYLKFLRARKK